VRGAAIEHDEEQRLVRAFFKGATSRFFVEVGARAAENIAYDVVAYCLGRGSFSLGGGPQDCFFS
jgi:hypothetical protein